jgi:hypothetical protein
MRVRQSFVLAAGMLFVAVIGAMGLVPRISAERSGSVAALVAEMRDVANMAREAGLPVEEAVEKLEAGGLTAVAVGELTGQELLSGMLPVEFDSACNLLHGDLPEGVWPDSATILFSGKGELDDRIRLFAETRFPGVIEVDAGEDLLLVLPISLSETLEAGILPDYPLLAMASRTGMPLIYRPGSTPGVSGDAVADSVEMVLDAFPNIRSVVPAGLFVAGYPELEPLSRLLRERGISVAKVEFSRQIGVGFLERALFPGVLSLHSVRKEEIVSRRLTRDDLVERFVRAARERSVQLLYLRPSDLLSGSRLDRFANECGRISGRLEKLGIGNGWPETLPLWRSGLFSAFACALALVLLSMRLVSRYFDPERDAGFKTMAALVGLSFVLAFLMLKISPVTRLSGALLAVLAATEASLLALENFRKPVRGVLMSVGVATASGLAIAGFFGTPWYMLRMDAFSGVKLTLLLPPLLVLLHDLKRRVHPESLENVLSRPPHWGELALIGGILAAAGLMVFRSGNVSFVPGWEIRFRELLEQILVARPRTKEIFAGYPALVLWFTVRRMDIWPRYREIFRLGTTLAFSSVVNSFCHFHTHATFIFLRVFNGLWTGLLVGLVLSALLVFLVLPAWRRWREVIAG